MKKFALDPPLLSRLDGALKESPDEAIELTGGDAEIQLTVLKSSRYASLTVTRSSVSNKTGAMLRRSMARAAVEMESRRGGQSASSDPRAEEQGTNSSEEQGADILGESATNMSEEQRVNVSGEQATNMSGGEQAPSVSEEQGTNVSGGQATNVAAGQATTWSEEEEMAVDVESEPQEGQSRPGEAPPPPPYTRAYEGSLRKRRRTIAREPSEEVDEEVCESSPSKRSRVDDAAEDAAEETKRSVPASHFLLDVRDPISKKTRQEQLQLLRETIETETKQALLMTEKRIADLLDSMVNVLAQYVASVEVIERIKSIIRYFREKAQESRRQPLSQPQSPPQTRTLTRTQTQTRTQPPSGSSLQQQGSVSGASSATTYAGQLDQAFKAAYQTVESLDNQAALDTFRRRKTMAEMHDYYAALKELSKKDHTGKGGQRSDAAAKKHLFRLVSGVEYRNAKDPPCTAEGRRAWNSFTDTLKQAQRWHVIREELGVGAFVFFSVNFPWTFLSRLSLGWVKPWAKFVGKVIPDIEYVGKRWKPHLESLIIGPEGLGPKRLAIEWDQPDLLLISDVASLLSERDSDADFAQLGRAAGSRGGSRQGTVPPSPPPSQPQPQPQFFDQLSPDFDFEQIQMLDATIQAPEQSGSADGYDPIRFGDRPADGNGQDLPWAALASASSSHQGAGGGGTAIVPGSQQSSSTAGGVPTLFSSDISDITLAEGDVHIPETQV